MEHTWIYGDVHAREIFSVRFAHHYNGSVSVWENFYLKLHQNNTLKGAHRISSESNKELSFSALQWILTSREISIHILEQHSLGVSLHKNEKKRIPNLPRSRRRRRNKRTWVFHSTWNGTFSFSTQKKMEIPTCCSTGSGKLSRRPAFNSAFKEHTANWDMPKMCGGTSWRAKFKNGIKELESHSVIALVSAMTTTIKLKFEIFQFFCRKTFIK